MAPLVFGSNRYRLASRNSKIFANGSFLPLKSARRKATVTISAPLASRASRISSGDENLPVPRISLELNSRPAIFNFVAVGDTRDRIGGRREFANPAWARRMERARRWERS